MFEDFDVFACDKEQETESEFVGSIGLETEAVPEKLQVISQRGEIRIYQLVK